MRPLELTLRSFRSFGDATVDFRGHRIVVISGDTGAGKTSLLDGIAFALFARTPEQSAAKELVTLGADNGEVRFSFTARGRMWQVTRRIGKNAPEPAHVLEELDADGSVIDRISGAAQVNARIPEIVGMSFAAFTSAVLLAQGRFAQFLQTNPRDRDVILRELFDVASLDSMRTAAVGMRDAAEREAAVLERERIGLPGHSDAMRNAQSALVRASAARLAELDTLRSVVESAERERAQYDDALAAAERIRAALTELPGAEAREAVVDAHKRAEQTVREARQVNADAQRSLDEAVSARDRLREAHGGTASEVAALRGLAERAAIAAESIPREESALREREAALVERRTQVTLLEDRAAAARVSRDDAQRVADAVATAVATADHLAEIDGSLSRVHEVRQRAADAARAATDEASIADAALDELRHAHLAASIRAQLAPGDPCPVCGHPLEDVSLTDDEDLGPVEDGVLMLRERAEKAVEALAAAEIDLRALTRAHAEAVTLNVAAQARLDELGHGGEVSAAAVAALTADAEARAQEVIVPQDAAAAEAAELQREAGSVAEARRRLTTDQADLDELRTRLGSHGGLDDPAGSLAAATRELEMLEQSVVSSSRYVAQAAGRAADADAVLTAIERDDLARLRSALAVVATRLGTEALPHDLPASQLPERADELTRQAELAAVEAEGRAAGAREAADDLTALVARRGAPLGIASPEVFASTHQSAAEALRAARMELAAIETVAVEGRRLARTATQALREAETYGLLANDLQANRFPRHLLARFHERLAMGASARLHALSHGAFTFAGEDPDPMAIVDHRRGRRTRSAATLSGGERFLASLALALALSDIASGSASRLECLFLDEGFSTLDAESLEIAMSGVEQMADDGRLVVVITHLPGVAERLGAAIRVWKDPATGTSQVVSSARARAPAPAEPNELRLI